MPMVLATGGSAASGSSPSSASTSRWRTTSSAFSSRASDPTSPIRAEADEMLEMKVHHTYVAGRATDVSGNGNHGVPTDTQASTTDGTSSLFFNGVGARVVIPPSEDFTEMRGFRIRVRVR